MKLPTELKKEERWPWSLSTVDVSTGPLACTSAYLPPPPPTQLSWLPTLYETLIHDFLNILLIFPLQRPEVKKLHKNVLAIYCCPFKTLRQPHGHLFPHCLPHRVTAQMTDSPFLWTSSDLAFKYKIERSTPALVLKRYRSTPWETLAVHLHSASFMWKKYISVSIPIHIICIYITDRYISLCVCYYHSEWYIWVFLRQYTTVHLSAVGLSVTVSSP